MFIGEEVKVRLTKRLRRVVQPKDLSVRPIDPREAALAILEVDTLRQIAQQGAEQVPFLNQRRFRPLALANVVDHSEVGDDPVVGVEERSRGKLDVNPGAVFPLAAQLHIRENLALHPSRHHRFVVF